MSALRKLAKGKQCYLRLYGVCNFNSETTVLAHVRRGHFGMGIKPPDIAAVPLCSACHDCYDGRTNADYSRTEMDAEMLRALCEWLHWLTHQRILKL